MTDMHHEIPINAAPEKVYEAIATQEGLRGWWTGDSAAEPRVGSVAEFGFYNRQFLFLMRIDELTPGKRVVWSCLGITMSGRRPDLRGRYPKETERPFSTSHTATGAQPAAFLHPATRPGGC